MTNLPKTLSINELASENLTYLIPMYQRNYAWEEAEITQLLNDIEDIVNDERIKSYYLGTLVVYPKSNYIYEVVDGQQRLTTLALVLTYLKNINQIQEKELSLKFENRFISDNTLHRIRSNDKFVEKNEHTANFALYNGYNIIQSVLEKNKELALFTKVFLNKIKILRVEVPVDTDLNHYFEIMNTRGEQLEKHEVLKAMLMKLIEKKYHVAFNSVWEACSNMEVYIHRAFTSKIRNVFFNESLTDLKVFNFMEIVNSIESITGLPQNKADESPKRKLSNIIHNSGIAEKNLLDDDDFSGRFNTLISFPNFLLHVLRIQTKQDITLDDKKLLESFSLYLKTKEDVETFLFNLLKCRYLLDRYIIKREFLKGTDNWSLKTPYRTNKSVQYKLTFSNYALADEESNISVNKQVLMLLAAFHVSTPTQLYKHWLNGALYFLFDNYSMTTSIDGNTYLNYLESMAKAFVFDRYLAQTPLDYYQIIYENDSKCQFTSTEFEKMIDNKLSYHTIENNFVFNYLDYLFWKEHILGNSETKKFNMNIVNFDFTFRSSVEHYYPQIPLDGYKILEEKYLHSFGNLCLISHSKNSRLSNFMPSQKQEFYYKNSIDSIKQYYMMQEKEWGEEQIAKHYEQAKELFLKEYNSK